MLTLREGRMIFLAKLAHVESVFRHPCSSGVLRGRQRLASYSAWLQERGVRMNRVCSQQECRDVSQCSTYNYGDAGYWDKRYKQNTVPFDWYQRYSGVAPLLERYIPKSSRILMAGCGNAVMSEDMAEDGYQEIINIDISSVVIDMMKKKYQHVPQLKYMTMDVQDLSLFADCSFDAVIDKGTLDSLMCGANAPFSAARMLLEVSRVLKSHGVYILITYGDPCVRMPHLNIPDYNWNITLYTIPRPGSENAISTSRVFTDPVPLNDDGSYVQPFMIDGPDCHYVYVCVKAAEV